MFEYTERETKHCLELLGNCKIILSFTNQCILVKTTERHELLHISSFQEEAVTKLILYAHEILKESSSKVAIHSPSLHGKPYFIFPDILKRWSFQKHRAGI